METDNSQDSGGVVWNDPWLDEEEEKDDAEKRLQKEPVHQEGINGHVQQQQNHNNGGHKLFYLFSSPASSQSSAPHGHALVSSPVRDVLDNAAASSPPHPKVDISIQNDDLPRHTSSPPLPHFESLERMVVISNPSHSNLQPQCILLAHPNIILGRGILSDDSLRAFLTHKNLPLDTQYVQMQSNDGSLVRHLSRFHCILSRHADDLRWYVTDLNSANGTYITVGGGEADRVPLVPGTPYIIPPTDFYLGGIESPLSGKSRACRIHLSHGTSQITFEVFTFTGAGGIRIGPEFQATVPRWTPRVQLHDEVSNDIIVSMEEKEREKQTLMQSGKFTKKGKGKRMEHPSPRYAPVQRNRKRPRISHTMNGTTSLRNSSPPPPALVLATMTAKEKKPTSQNFGFICSQDKGEEEEQILESIIRDVVLPSSSSSGGGGETVSHVKTTTGREYSIGEDVMVQIGQTKTPAKILAIKNAPSGARLFLDYGDLPPEWMDEHALVTDAGVVTAPPNGKNVKVDPSLVIELASPRLFLKKKPQPMMMGNVEDVMVEDSSMTALRVIFRCGICHSPPFHAALLPECGCLFCQQCLFALFGNNRKDQKCPTCGKQPRHRTAYASRCLAIEHALKVIYGDEGSETVMRSPEMDKMFVSNEG